MQIVQLLIFLILFPLIAAFFLFLAKKDIERAWIVKLSALVIAIVSVYLLISTYNKGALLVSVIPATVRSSSPRPIQADSNRLTANLV